MHIFGRNGNNAALMPAAGGGLATIFTDTLTTNDSGGANYTYRNVLPITGNAGTQVRVTFEASSAAAFSVDNASIGILTGATYDTTAAPVELLFSGVSGFALSAGQTIVSDWANLSGFTSSNKLVVSIDLASTNGNPRGRYSGGPAGSNCYYASNDNSYNETVPSPTFSGSVFSGGVLGLNKIEVQ